MQPVASAIDGVGGVATRQQLLARGFSGYDLTLAVRSGAISRIRQARYVTSVASADALAAARVGGLLAGPSAASSYGLWAGFDTRLHLSVGDNSSRLRTNIRPSLAHSGRRLTPDISSRETVIHWLRAGAVPEQGPECWRVSLGVCLRQMAAWSDEETAMACLESALRQMTKASLALEFSGEPLRHRLMVGRARPGCDSGLESMAAFRLERAGIEVIHQIVIPGLGRFDLGVVGTKVIIEIDGFAFHSDHVAFENDRRRRTELAARGYIVVVLTARQITSAWAWCEQMIVAAVAQSAA